MWIQGWFCNIKEFERITREDILDFIAWGYWGIRCALYLSLLRLACWAPYAAEAAAGFYACPWPVFEVAAEG